MDEFLPFDEIPFDCVVDGDKNKAYRSIIAVLKETNNYDRKNRNKIKREVNKFISANQEALKRGSEESYEQLDWLIGQIKKEKIDKSLESFKGCVKIGYWILKEDRTEDHIKNGLIPIVDVLSLICLTRYFIFSSCYYTSGREILAFACLELLKERLQMFTMKIIDSIDTGKTKEQNYVVSGKTKHYSIMLEHMVYPKL